MIKMSQIARVGLIWAVTMVGVGESSRADTIVQTYLNTGQSNPFTDNFPMDQFNPADGTLQSVTVAEQTTVIVQVSILNTTDGALTYSNVSASVPVTLTGPAGLIFDDTASTSSWSGTVPAHSADSNFLSGSISPSTTLSTSSEFMPYLGTGMIDFSFSAGADTLSGTWPAGLQVSVDIHSVESTITITYTYLPAVSSVPEPSSVVLLGFGGAAVWVAVRKARRPA